MGRGGCRPPALAALFYGALAAVALLGVRDVLFVYEENRCSMTYMYEYPEYLKIKLPKKTARRYPAYELYLYGEGNYAEENKNLLLTGIPVLFLPGNAGSYKQVRSLGSIALRKAEDVDFKYHFNFFSVNFNEELVALYGGSLQRQTKFVHECIKVILKLYRSSAVPRVWASTDHLSIVWCKELILATIRAFFDLIDENTRQITEDPKKRMSVLNHHFVRHPAKIFEENPEAFTGLTGAFIWITVKASKWTYSVYNDSNGKYFTFPLASHRKSYSHVYCENSMLDTSSWIYGCMNSNSSMCLEATDLSWRAELLPTTKVVILKLQDYPSLSHIVIQVPPTVGNKYTLDCEFFKEDSRRVQLPVTHLFSFGFSSSKITLNSTGLLYNVQLQHFNQIYQAFKIYIESHCQSLKERKPSVYRLHIPWSHEDSVAVAKVPSSTEISAKLHIAQPQNDSRVPELNIYSSSDCQYEVILKTSLLQILGQIIRFHAGALPVYVVSNILLAYGGQLSTLISAGQCSDFSLELVRTAKPYKVEPLLSIVVFLQGFNWFREIWESLSLPEVDAAVLSSQDAWFPLVSLILFLLGTGIAYWNAVFFSTSLRLFSSLWLTLFRPTVLRKDNKLITPRRFCVVLSLALVSWTTCGAFAVFLIYLQYLFKVIKIHVNVRAEENMFNGGSDCKKETSQNSSIYTVKNQSSMDSTSKATQSLCNSTIAEGISSLKMHVTILNLFTWIVLLNLPSLIYWLKNLRYSVRLDPDPCRSTAIILVCILEILMNSSTSEVKSSKLLKIAAKVPLPLSVAMLAFGRMHLYKVPHFVTFSLLLHVLCCIV
ncbi:GPI inositol-deacylase isoform X3 [Strix uralensis]|uniref:GPI inositol-deacylase isoform X3 n=1 Tax=Strix uralensis TaxID=36305 RepID=UPI003DA70C1C